MTTIITTEAMHRYMLRRWLEDDAERMATLVWWGRYHIDDAISELRATALTHAERAKMDRLLARSVADDTFLESMQRHRTQHEASLAAMKDAALETIRAGGTHAQTRRAVVAVAKARDLPPPPHMLEQAVQEAAKEYRRLESWWRKREAAE